MRVRKMRSLVAAGAVICLSLLTAAHAGPRLDKIMESKVLRVGTPGDYRPFAIKTDAGYSGHDIDVIELMAKEMGVKVEYVATSWPNLMKDLQNVIPALHRLNEVGVEISISAESWSGFGVKPSDSQRSRQASLRSMRSSFC